MFLFLIIILIINSIYVYLLKKLSIKSSHLFFLITEQPMDFIYFTMTSYFIFY